MSLISERNSSVSTKALPFDGKRFEIVGGRLVTLTDNPKTYIEKGYDVNDIVFSIINVILDKVRLAPWAVYKVKDESSLKAYHSMQRKQMLSRDEVRKCRDLYFKSLEPVNNAGKWSELLDYPNEEDSFSDFFANGCGYKLLTGNKYIWADILESGANKGAPNSLHLMPSQYMQLYVSGGFPSAVTGYRLSLFGANNTKANYDKEEVLHEKYMNYDWDTNGLQHIGIAPLKAMLRRINRNNSAIDASTAKYQNGGLEAIIYVDEENVQDKKSAFEQAKQIKRSLITEYSGPVNHGKIAVSGHKMGVAPLGLSPVDLNIIEAEKLDVVGLCAPFGVPPELVGYTGTKTYDNIRTAEKALTTRCALPLLTSGRNSFNRKFSEWGLKKGWIVDFDMTVYSELNENTTEMLNWVTPLAKITGLSPNRILDLVGLEKIDDEYYDKPRVTLEMGASIDEYQMNDVDNALNDGN